MSDQPRDLDERLRRLLGEPEPGDDALIADPELRRLVSLLDDIDTDEPFEEPPPRLWDAIASATGVEDATATVVPLRRPARPPWWLGAAAAVLVVLVVAVGALAIATGRDGAEQEIAAAELDVLIESQAHGAARLVRAGDTDPLVLVLDVGGLDPVDGYYEVWLLTPEVDGLVSLGPLRSDGRYELPVGLDPIHYSVVDVSIEPHDGDPTHSGNSVLRGGLVEA
jgi:hypothetical protein